jgi:hypothetical protein
MAEFPKQIPVKITVDASAFREGMLKAANDLFPRRPYPLQFVRIQRWKLWALLLFTLLSTVELVTEVLS